MFTLYLRTYFSLSALTLLSLWLFNFSIDPLWYSNGNRITGKNFAFNERVSKTNLFFQNREKYDCLIFGSSTATLLNASMLKRNQCYNFSFSNGSIEDFIEYAKYLRGKGFNPKKVYVNVESYQFFNKSSNADVPNFIKTGGTPETIYTAYLSLDALNFSVRTIRENSQLDRYYNKNFETEVAENLHNFKIRRLKANNLVFYKSRVLYYKTLKDVFPNAQFIGYVPPLSPWHIISWIYSFGLLDSYLQSIYDLSNIFDEMYDFSVPSAVTSGENNTYDGIHYYPEINKQIAAILEGKKSDFGIKIDKNNFSEYQNFYKGSVQNFLENGDKLRPEQQE